jgi:transaldolase
MTNALHRLHAEQDQSPWIDFIDRDLLTSGKLEQMVTDGIRGLTSNPTIFAKAVATGQYDELIRREIEAGDDARQIYEQIAVSDVGDAADVLRRVHDESGGADGFASIEVEPDLSEDTERTVARARELWGKLERPNVFIKIPATRAGVPAIEAAIADGINVNVTLLFAVSAHARVIEAYLAGLEDRAAKGKDLAHVASVASFFVSRVDSAIDGALDGMVRTGALPKERAAALQGRAAIANAKLAYRLFQQQFSGPRWATLSAKGAQVQRPLWASTSTKNPSYRDVIYVEQLIGPDTVNTMPPATLEAFRDHGIVARTVDADLQGAESLLADLGTHGIELGAVTDRLLVEGLASFQKSFDTLIAGLEGKAAVLGRTLAVR